MVVKSCMMRNLVTVYFLQIFSVLLQGASQAESLLYFWQVQKIPPCTPLLVICPPAPIQTLNCENQKFKAFRPLVYCYEEPLAMNGYSPPWLDLLWFGKTSCFCATGNKKDPKSLTSHHVKNSISWSHFKNHYQLYSGKMPFWPETVGWRVSQEHRRWGSFSLEYCVCRRVWMHVRRPLCLEQEEQIKSQISQRPGRTPAPPASVLVIEPRFLKQIKQGLDSSAAICVTLRDSGVVLEFQIPLLQKRKNSLNVYEDSKRPSSGWGLSMCHSVLNKHSVLIFWLNHMNQDRHPALTECPFNATYCSKCFIFLFIKICFVLIGG